MAGIAVLAAPFVSSAGDFDHVVSRWTFSEGSGAIAKDQVGTSDMTLVNSPAWGANEIRFSGSGSTGSYGRTAVLSDLSGPFSMTFDLRIDANSNENSVIFKQEDGWGHVFMLIYDSAAAGYILLIRNSSDALIAGQQKLVIGQWHHFVVAHNGGTVEVWVDGQLDICERISMPGLAAPIYPLTLASNTPETTGAGAFTSCSFRDLVIYNSPLSPALTTRSEIGRALTPRGVLIPQSGRGNIEMSPLRLASGQWVSPYTINGLDIAPSIGWATSPDGMAWTKHGAILGQGIGGEPTYCARGFLLEPEPGTIELYYASDGGNTGSIRRVTSTDGGATWSAPTTMLDLVEAPMEVIGYTNLCVIHDGSQWVMFVETLERSGSYPSGTGPSYQIRKAVSADRLHWTVGSSPITSLRRFPHGMASHPSVVRVDGLWHMFYHASSQFIVPSNIFHAVSQDLNTWINLPYPLITISSEPTGAITWMDQVADVTVREYDGTTYFFYDCDDNANGLADLRLRTFDGPLSELVRLDPVIFPPPANDTASPPPPPKGTLLGKTRITTTHSTVRIRGKAAYASAVRYRLVGQRRWKLASGTQRWQFKIRPKPGRNEVLVVADGPSGTVRIARLVVIRTAPPSSSGRQ